MCVGMADSFAAVRSRAEEAGRAGTIDRAPEIRDLSPQQRKALSLFLHSKTVTAKDVGAFFKASPRAAADLCVRWVKDGFLVVSNPSKRARSYRLTDRYE